MKGLSREVKHESYREGGVNEYEHKLLTQVSYPVLVLERGLALDDLWKWALAAADGDVKRKTIRIRLQDEANEKAWAWQIEHAFPVKWSSSDLDAQLVAGRRWSPSNSRIMDCGGRYEAARALAGRSACCCARERPAVKSPMRWRDARARAAAGHRSHCGWRERSAGRWRGVSRAWSRRCHLHSSC